MSKIISDQQQESSISFSKLLYSGTYKETDGDPTLDIDDTILINTEGSVDNILVSITNGKLLRFLE